MVNRRATSCPPPRSFGWIVLVGLVLVIGTILRTLASPVWPWAHAAVCSLLNVSGVVLLLGATMLSIDGSEGWPPDPIAVAVLLMAGLVALTPLAWLWRPLVTPALTDGGRWTTASIVVSLGIGVSAIILLLAIPSSATTPADPVRAVGARTAECGSVINPISDFDGETAANDARYSCEQTRVWKGTSAAIVFLLTATFAVGTAFVRNVRSGDPAVPRR